MFGRLSRETELGHARRGSRRLHALIVPAVALLLLAAAGAVALAVGGSTTTTPPNILFIVTDDQRADGTLDVMPITKQYFESGGTEFKQAFATTTACCPSRASIFSGRYTHNHEVRQNDSAVNLDQRYTLQRYLQDAGYLTGIYGKYFNAWNLLHNPPNFDKWSIFTAGYTPIRVNEQGVVKGVTTYATTYVGDNAVQFIQNSESNDSQPWFLYLAPTAPHAPFTPDAPYANASVPAFNAPPSYFETDRTDKPPRIQLRKDDPNLVQTDRTQQLRTLMSVDDMVNRVFQTLEATGEASDTLAVFVGDNGYEWGEHGSEGKGDPYLESVKIPMLMRWPSHVAAGASDQRLVANIDLPVTALDAAGIAAAAPMDGHSLLGATSRSRLLLDFYKDATNGRNLRDWASLVTPTSQYTEWFDHQAESTVNFREYYNLSTDPYELDNLLSDGNSSNDPNTAPLAAQLRQDLTCSGAACP
jgi:arylsulfatase A-like enzyme